jgi:bifunctional non-homologous end joining protein LigD
MLLTTTTDVPSDDGWALEVKWDGMRAQLAFDGPRVALRSLRGRECGEQFPELHAIGEELPGPAVLDCELVCCDAEGLPDFDLLRSRIRMRSPSVVGRARRETPATLMIFDVLHLAGAAVRREPYRERRALIDELALNGSAWRTPRAFSTGEDLFSVTRQLRLEGVVAKRLDAPYQPGRRGDAWLKSKHRRRERLTMTAWRPGGYRRPDELLLSRRDSAGGFRHAGAIPVGMGPDARALRAMLDRIEQRPTRRSRIRAVRPLVEVDVDHHGRPGGSLRDPVVRGWYVS